MDSTEEETKRRSDAVTSNVSLIDLRLRQVNAKLLVLLPELDLEVWPTVNPQMTVFDEHVIYDVTYDIAAQDARGRRAIEASATLTLIFQVMSEDIGSEDLAAFGALGVLSVAHPYIRELFHNITGRMGVPPLLLEVMPPEPEKRL